MINAGVVRLGAVMILLSVAPAAAHPMPGVSDFYAGMLHPITTIEFLLPLLALGLLAGQQNKHVGAVLLALVPLGLLLGAVGALVIPLALPLKSLAFVVMILLGGVVAVGKRLPIIVAIAIATLPAAVVGWSNGAEIDAQMSAWRFISGLVLVGAMLATYAVGLLSRFQAPWIRIGCRVVGSWIAATGVLAQSLG